MCSCKFPQKVTQKYLGGNCDVDIACGPYGHLKDFDTFECVCNVGYKLQNDKCVEMLPEELSYNMPCEQDEFEQALPEYGFHLNYFNKHKNKRCIKKPCSFDSLTGKPLKNNKFLEGFGCVCDPLYGSFGIWLNNYLNVPGPTACVNIFQQEPTEKQNAKLFAFYCMFDKPPISFIQFSNLNPDLLVDPFRDYVQLNKNLQIEQKWPYDFMQYVFRHLDYTVHTRSCVYDDWDINKTCNEKENSFKRMTECREISKHVNTYLDPHTL
ncbi:uncharacterized protein TNIN_3561 [Trichonephila inaurata madagascariensis]|uniref:Uncharacterized protein n=1 Tax=Trichonephila inaurata madagascariensis TaxID=2747483 RepID=A0A8X6WS94_9ARAC|nr:uncharacterized protein TNIN_3561 [Trichonephila inaurata madagascariensis]